MAYNLGTAYIRIAPSLQGVQSKITRELNAAGSAGGDAFNGSLMKKVAQGTFLGNVASKVFSAVANGIRGSLDSAINRSDELSYRFAKSMENVGIDTEKAKDAISRVSDALIGLPTTTDQAAKSIKKFASASGDVDKASDYFLAVNNALIAGASPTERQAEAIQQISEAYSRGKPDMKEWRILMETMPGQMRQVSDAMGYGAENVQQLGEDLRTGKVPMDEFMNTFVKLNETSADGSFIGFADQAQNAASGLEVSMTRMRTAITRGLAGAIDSLQGGNNDIGKAFISMGQIFEGLLSNNEEKIQSGADGLVKAIQTLGPRIKTMVGTMMKTLTNFLRTQAPTILNELIRGAIDIVVDFITYLPQLISAIVDYLPSLIQTLVDSLFNPDTLQKLLNAAYDMMFAIIDALPDIIVALVEALPTIITSIVEVLTSPDSITRILAVGPKLMIALAKGLIVGIADLLIGVGQVVGKLVSEFGKVPGKIVEIGRRIVEGLWNGINSAVDWIKDKISGFCNTALDAIKDFFGIKSPSKVMAEQGKYLAQGLGNGIRNNAKYAVNAMDAMAKDVLEEAPLIGSEFSTPLSQGLGVGGNAITPNINQFNTFNQVANNLDVLEISRDLGFAVETAI